MIKNAHSPPQLESKEPICPRCNKPYKSKRSFVKHLRQCILGVESEPDLSFECKLCLAVLSSQQTFDNHMQLHHTRIDLNVSVECPECSEKIESKMLLTQHYRVNIAFLKNEVIMAFSI